MNSQMVNGNGNNGIGDGLSANLDSQMVNDIGNNVNNFNFRKKFKKNREHFDLSVLHWNCNGLTSKIDQLKSYLLKKKPDIVSLNEIKCNTNSAIFNLNMLNYNSIFKVREGNMGGGVALLINKNHSFVSTN